MNDEQFKNLDEVMKKNLLRTDKALPKLSLPKSKPSFLWKSFALGATALAVITFVQNSRYNTKIDSILALNETMSWDVTSEEWPVGFEEEMDYLDLFL